MPVAKKTTGKKATKATPQPAEQNVKLTKKEVVKQVAPEPEPEPVPVVQETAAVENEVLVEAGPTLQDDLSGFMARLQLLGTTINALRSEYRVLEKRINRDMKTAQKNGKKNKKAKNPNRQPSGFVKPTQISTELANFLGKDKGVEMARTEVTREINKYIREHGLQDKDNGRKINPDTKLKSLLKVPSDQDLTYFNLQKYMSPHFAKNGVPLVEP